MQNEWTILSILNISEHSIDSIVLAIVLITKCSLKPSHGTKSREQKRPQKNQKKEKHRKIMETQQSDRRRSWNVSESTVAAIWRIVAKACKSIKSHSKKKNQTDNRTIKTCTLREANKPFSG